MKRSIAPRLQSRDIRESNTSHLPDDVKRILQIMARDEKCSVSWVIEQILITYLNLDIDYKVKLVQRK